MTSRNREEHQHLAMVSGQHMGGPWRAGNSADITLVLGMAWAIGTSLRRRCAIYASIYSYITGLHYYLGCYSKKEGLEDCTFMLGASGGGQQVEPGPQAVQAVLAQQAGGVGVGDQQQAAQGLQLAHLSTPPPVHHADDCLRHCSLQA